MRMITVATSIALLSCCGWVSMTSANEPPALDAPSMSLVNAARADLAQRLGISADAIALIQFNAVTWPDAGMGCPKPGIAYTQVQRDGYRIELENGGRHFWYHGGSGRPPFLCENPQRENPQRPPAGAKPDQRT